jgi:hypothetical protein
MKKIRTKKLNQAGFDHIILGLFIAIVVGLIGTYLLVASRAASASGHIVGVGGQCLDDPKDAKVNGTPLQIWECNTLPNQTWTVNNGGAIVNANGYCLNANGTTSESLVTMHICNQTTLQQWTVNNTTHTIVNKASGLCLDDKGANPANGNTVWVYTCNGTVAQVWTPPAAPASAPVVSLSASPTSVKSGTASTLNWSATNATSCTAGGGWSGSKAMSGSASTGVLSATKSFSLSCTGNGGSGSASATVSVTSVASGCKLTAATLEPTCGVLWAEENNGGNVPRLAADESQLNATLSGKSRKFDIFRRFYSSFSTPFLSSADHDVINSGHILFLSWNAGGTTYPNIANGSQNGVIDAAAAKVKALGSTKIFIDFQHEPDHFSVHDQSDPANSGANYAKAYQHVHDRFKQDGVTNVVWAWVMGGEKDTAHRNYDKAAYPGDAYVDWIGYDAYSGNSPYTEHTTFYDTVVSYYNWLAGGGISGAPNAIGGSNAMSKPWLLGELGEYSGFASGPNWFASIPSGLSQLKQLKMLVYFNSGGVSITDNNGATPKPGDTAGFAKAGVDPSIYPISHSY